MSLLARMLVLFVVIFHTIVFVVETFFWMQPAVHQFALRRLTEQANLSSYDQALVLKTVFVNLGFYNLFLAIAGTIGLAIFARGHASAGRALMGYACFSAAGAGIVLLVSTHAYIAAFLQAAPAAAALAMMFRAIALDPIAGSRQ